MLRVSDDKLWNVQDVRLIGNQGLCEQRLNPGQLLLLIDISKLCYVALFIMDLQAEALYSGMKLITNQII